jgi:iron complex transport system substrate-binding protein
MPQQRHKRFPGRAVLAGLVLLFGIGAARAEPRPKRVVSINLCADQLLLALADREQIASLSFLVRDRSISYLADRAAGVPINDGRGEAILFSGADLVLAESFGERNRMALLKRQGLAVLAVEPWQSLAQGREQIRTVARRLGHPERGEALIAAIDAALERTKGIVPAGRSILTFERRGWVPGARSLFGEILNHMGFTLHQDALGLGEGGVARLESIVSRPPDYLLLDESAGRSAGQAVDNGTALLVHPALAASIPSERRLVVANRLSICGGPSTAAAIGALAEQVRAKVR